MSKEKPIDSTTYEFDRHVETVRDIIETEIGHAFPDAIVESVYEKDTKIKLQGYNRHSKWAFECQHPQHYEFLNLINTWNKISPNKPIPDNFLLINCVTPDGKKIGNEYRDIIMSKVVKYSICHENGISLMIIPFEFTTFMEADLQMTKEYIQHQIRVLGWKK